MNAVGQAIALAIAVNEIAYTVLRRTCLKAVSVPIRMGICCSCKYRHCYKVILLSHAEILGVRHAEKLHLMDSLYCA